MNRPRPLLYNPDQKSPRQLIDEFVIRQKEFRSLMQELEGSSRQTSPQHYLIVGQRGMGKTTLLLRVKYAIEASEALQAWLLPVRFSEEQYQIARLDRLWEEIADHLELADPVFAGLLAQMEAREDEPDYERLALDILVGALRQHGKRVLVMIDNLGDLFHKFSLEENHRLREVLLSRTEIQVMGASSVMLEDTFRYDKPFYEFFQLITLQPINRDSAFALLKVLGRQYGQEAEVDELIASQPARIEVLRRLTGGVPRTLALLFGVFMDHHSGSTFEDLQLLLDEVNSLYKHRMDEMKPQQQQIIDALAKAWDPITASEVLVQSKLNREGIATNQISAQLKTLTENQMVEALPGTGKTKSYRIRERFFNIWYLMRYGKKRHREEVLWLVRFLETWCTRPELQLHVQSHLHAMQEGSYSSQAGYLKTMALYHLDDLDTSQKLHVLDAAETYLSAANETLYAQTISQTRKRELDKYIDTLWKKLVAHAPIDTTTDLPDHTESCLYIIRAVIAKCSQEKLKPDAPILAQLKSMLEIGVNLGDSVSMFDLAWLYQNEYKDKAIQYYLMAVDKGDTRAMNNLANLYGEQYQDYQKAEKYYLMAVVKGDIKAMYNLALVYYEEYKDYLKAEKYYLMAVDKGDIDAMNNLVVVYYETHQLDKLLQVSTAFLENESFTQNERYLINLTKLLLQAKQYHFLLQQFRKPDSCLRQQVRPMYYALAWFMKDELPGEYEKVSPELKETVDEIIRKVEKVHAGEEAPE